MQGAWQLVTPKITGLVDKQVVGCLIAVFYCDVSAGGWQTILVKSRRFGRRFFCTIAVGQSRIVVVKFIGMFCGAS
jgi:hypothetical protein